MKKDVNEFVTKMTGNEMKEFLMVVENRTNLQIPKPKKWKKETDQVFVIFDAKTKKYRIRKKLEIFVDSEFQEVSKKRLLYLGYNADGKPNSKYDLDFCRDCGKLIAWCDNPMHGKKRKNGKPESKRAPFEVVSKAIVFDGEKMSYRRTYLDHNKSGNCKKG